MKTLVNSSVFALVLAFSTPLFADDPQWMKDNNLVQGTVTLQDSSKIQVYGTQEDLDKLQKNLGSIQSIQIGTSQDSSTTSTTTPPSNGSSNGEGQ
ncbi:hypothetical protein EP47_03640 [Legionella norrlandica]|uniref:Uncharacterized protein n=1 Tax=Legionella norrlandica TaxID=1498499 RepID=A0A0A2SWB2_9GAMM|nr:hypothetical protein [Legionella norrlandica]KGP64026.1 hypothetical protein EP47_03640 [Legionella norrlandica]